MQLKIMCEKRTIQTSFTKTKLQYTTYDDLNNISKDEKVKSSNYGIPSHKFNNFSIKAILTDKGNDNNVLLKP